MILGDFLRALGQLGDRRFRRVLWLGLALTIALLVAVLALFLWFLQAVMPDTVEIPLVGPVGGIDTLVSWGSALFMLGLSVFLMVPVAALFTGLFLDEVAQAVEDRHYPGLPPVPRLPLADVLIDSLNFFGALIAVNALALALLVFSGPLAPLGLVLLNGYLLGREYFTVAAMRRLGRRGARELRRRHALTIWAAGVLMAVPLTVPILNLIIPILGAATFTHLFHRLQAQGPSSP